MRDSGTNCIATRKPLTSSHPSSADRNFDGAGVLSGGFSIAIWAAANDTHNVREISVEIACMARIALRPPGPYGRCGSTTTQFKSSFLEYFVSLAVLGVPSEPRAAVVKTPRPSGTCRAAARYYAVPGRLVGLSALKTNAAAAPPSSSATM